MNLELLENFGQNYPEDYDGALDCFSMALVSQFNRQGTLLAVGCNDGRLVIWDFLTRGENAASSEGKVAARQSDCLFGERIINLSHSLAHLLTLHLFTYSPLNHPTIHWLASTRTLQSLSPLIHLLPPPLSLPYTLSIPSLIPSTFPLRLSFLLIPSLLPSLNLSGIAKSINAHVHPICSLSWTRNGRRIVSASTDNCVCVWDILSGDCVHKFRFPSPVLKVMANPRNSNLLLVCPLKHSPVKIEIESGQHSILPLDDDGDPNVIASFDRRGKYVST